ncbi:MAG: MarR family transcriptional regulator [Planctomycetaceae bacterium]|jgi:predicted ArsR family transcriptional regulator|nr:MarR family transcriptional regulator [Planctomycetaceae bacterium]
MSSNTLVQPIVSGAGLRIVRLLVGKPPQTITELVKALNVTRTAVTEQVNELVAIGFLEQKIEHNGGRGRPRYLFSATDLAMRKLFEGLHDLVVPSAWRSIRERLGDQILNQISCDVAADIADFYIRKLTASSPKERVHEFAAFLVRNGRLLECRESNGNIEMKKYNCPFISMIEETRTVCHIDRLCMQLLLGQGASVEQLENRLDGHLCCKFLFKFAPHKNKSNSNNTNENKNNNKNNNKNSNRKST